VLVGPRDLADVRLRQIERGVLVAMGAATVALLATEPAVRRLAGQAVRLALTTWLPAAVVREVRDAWQRAAEAPPTHEGV
jgi:hypothetical protein